MPPNPESLAPASAVAADLLLAAEGAAGATQYLNEIFPALVPALSADFAAVVRPEGQTFRTLAETGIHQSWPAELVSECLDREAPQSSGPWLAAPLAPREPGGEVLLVHRSNAAAAERSLPQDFEAIVAALGAGLRIVRARQRFRKRATQAETILSIVQQWGRTQEMQPLLEQMATASTQLLEADRASIFLWDRTNHLLIGRPALGVKGGELRVPDNAGVVGEVLRSGEPRRVSQRDKIDSINRRIDAQLKYQTRTLLAVPLRSAGGEMLGVFEVLNKKDGDFSSEDEAALVELAAHAAVALENTQDRQNLLSSHRQMVDQAAEHVRLIGECPAIEALRSTVQPCGQYRLGGAGARPQRHRQRGREPVDSLSWPAPRSTVCGRQLRRHRGNTFGKRTVRPRERRLYRRPRIAGRKIRTGHRRHAAVG